MAVFDHLSNLLLTAERASAKGAVTLDLFSGNECPDTGTALAPLREHTAPIGRVVAEQGRICWVISKGGDACLSDVLALHTGIERERFEHVYAEAREAGVPFCEKLADMGIVEPEVARQVLRKQTASALAELARIESQQEVLYSVATMPPAHYDVRFTFEALELLEVAITQSAELKAELGELPPTFERVSPRVQAALCFRESESSDIPLVPVASNVRRSFAISEAVELALKGLDATQPGDLFAAEISPFALIASGDANDSECWVCSYTAPHLCLYQIDTQAQYLGVLSSLLADRRETLRLERLQRRKRGAAEES